MQHLRSLYEKQNRRVGLPPSSQPDITSELITEIMMKYFRDLPPILGDLKPRHITPLFVPSPTGDGTYTYSTTFINLLQTQYSKQIVQDNFGSINPIDNPWMSTMQVEVYIVLLKAGIIPPHDIVSTATIN